MTFWGGPDHEFAAIIDVMSHSPRHRIRTPLVAVAAVAGAVAFGVAGTGIATAGEPGPVAPHEFSYTATHAITQRASDMKVSEFLASLPVPPDFRQANLAMAARFDVIVKEALALPGGCIQVNIDPQPGDGSPFHYGFYALDAKYCP